MIRLTGNQETRLQEALLNVYLNSTAFDVLLSRVDKSYAQFAIENSNYRQNVLAVVKDAAATGWLMSLIAKARADVPDPELRKIEQELAAFAPPPGMDFFDMCRLGGGHVMVDRLKLREALRDISGPVGRRILIVKGEKKTGKSHSLQLVSYLNQMLGQFVLVVVDLEALKLMSGTTNPIDPMYLAERIVGQLPSGLNLPEPPTDAQWSNWVIRFCDRFQTYGQTNKNREHWIVIDSFNNVPLEQSAFDLIKELARRINFTLPNFRLLLLGYTESLPQSVLPHVAEESIEPICETHLIEFFYQAYQQSRMPLDEQKVVDAVQRLFNQLDPNQPDFLERLGPLVSEELTKVITPGGANG